MRSVKEPLDVEPWARTAPAELDSPLIAIRGLAVDYGDRPALRIPHLELRRGRVTAIVGPSGCGKSTLLHCLNRMDGLVPGCRVEGSIELEGRDILARGVDLIALRRNVGLIFQRPTPFPLSIRANLHLPLKELGLARAEREERAQRALADVGLLDEVRRRLDSPATCLSGGQQQRLCIARALVLEPRVLLMDEPCSALDPLAAERIEELMRALRGRYTLVLVTHNLAQARRLADDAAVFWADDQPGRILESGPAEQVLQHPRDPLARLFVNGTRG